MIILYLIQSGVKNLSRVLLPVESSDEEKHDKHDPESRKCSVNWKLSERVDDENLSPWVVKWWRPFFVDHKNLNFEFIKLINKNRNQSESNHKSENNVESNIQRRLIWNESVNVWSGFSENKPVSSYDKQEIKHPKWPKINKVKEKQEWSFSVEVPDVSFYNCMYEDQYIDNNENGQDDTPKSCQLWCELNVKR